MPKRPTLAAQKRTVSGRRVKQLRSQSLIPANIFGKKVKSLSLQLTHAEFAKLYAQSGETTLLDLNVDGEKTPRAVLIANVQIHPVTQAILHVDFHQVSLTEKVTANIPVVLSGESPAVKEFGGIVVNPVSELEVEALPTDLPDNFEVDITSLKEIGSVYTAADLKYDKNKLTLKSDPSQVIVTIQQPKEEEVEEAVTPPPEAAAAETSAGEATPETSSGAKPEPASDSSSKPEKS